MAIECRAWIIIIMASGYRYSRNLVQFLMVEHDLVYLHKQPVSRAPPQHHDISGLPIGRRPLNAGFSLAEPRHPPPADWSRVREIPAADWTKTVWRISRWREDDQYGGILLAENVLRFHCRLVGGKWGVLWVFLSSVR